MKDYHKRFKELVNHKPLTENKKPIKEGDDFKEHIISMIESGDMEQLQLAQQLCKGQKINFKNLIQQVWGELLQLVFKKPTYTIERVLELYSKSQLVLRHLGITSLPDDIGRLTNLEDLYFNKNQLTYLPESIGNLTNLKILDLEDNELTYLPESIGNLTNLTFLGLRQNLLISLPESIGNLNNLETLNLSQNKLTSLPKNIVNLSKLERLIINDNKLKYNDIENVKSSLPKCMIYAY